MKEKTINGAPLNNELLDQVSGGATVEEMERYCPNCGRVTLAYPVSSRLYNCSVCHVKHNGERVVATPRA